MSGDEVKYQDDKVNFSGEEVIFSGEEVIFSGEQVKFSGEQLICKVRRCVYFSNSCSPVKYKFVAHLTNLADLPGSAHALR